MTNKLLEQVEQAYLKKDVPQFTVGDTVDVHTRIVEGDKERIQVFSGTVIMKKGAGMNESFTVRRIVNNEGVERIFPLHSPFVARVAANRAAPSSSICASAWARRFVWPRSAKPPENAKRETHPPLPPSNPSSP